MNIDKDQKIKELEEQIQIEINVKKSEVILNEELMDRVEKHQLQIESLLKINEEYAEIISKLRRKLKTLIIQS